ncbi:unnamed protein product [Urochloa decumbens]|uniref:Protein kinase domain-containing protein n=1 Tax=Urochloa decumbens TaxID=240449 RepID=A0ABC9G8A1_9POAL
MSSPALSLLPTPTLLAAFMLTAIAAAAGRQCPTKCGDVEIPYPFGIGAGCFRSKGFEISCIANGTNNPMVALSSATRTIPVTSLSVAPLPEAKVMLPVAYRCYNSTGGTMSEFDGHVDVNKHGVYRISAARNMFVVLGCNTGAYTVNSYSNGTGRYDHQYYMGCFTYCSGPTSATDGRCASVGCCHVDIAPGLTDSLVNFQHWPHDGMEEYSPCDMAFLVDKHSYGFRASDLRMDVSRASMPVWLDWAIRDDSALSCAGAKNSSRYACVSVKSEKAAAVLREKFQWQEALPRATMCLLQVDPAMVTKPQCICSDGDVSVFAAVSYWCCISLAFSLLAVALLFTVIVCHKRRMNQLFQKNGGSVIQQVDNIRIFTKEELKKITKNNSHILGKGGSGQVYKGTLEDSTTVAVKASIEVSEALKEDFTNEVIIQSQMIHKNIIKLLGCCLEVDVPMLVYEFAPNGNLHNILHGKDNRHLSLSLDLRLDIATESAEGLKYMHWSTNHTIRHGDVKSGNILLDANFMPKISDFGTSKLLGRDEDFATFVVGSMGYIDPVFHQTGLLTQKSDVYSFVLLELICRKPTIYDEHCSLVIEFHRVLAKDNSGRATFDKDISVTEEDVFVLEEIGKLAIECLNEEVEARPDMKEVA